MATSLANQDELLPAVDRTLEDCALAIDQARAKTVESIFEIGKHLKIAHDALANQKNGTFQKWVVDRCGISKTTAAVMLNVIDAFGDKYHPGLGRYTAEALYYLSRHTTPEEAIEDAKKLAAKGQPIGLKQAKAIVAEYTVDAADDDTPTAVEDEPDEPCVPDVPEWDAGEFDQVTKRQANDWLRRCPRDQWRFIIETLQGIISKIERRQSDG